MPRVDLNASSAIVTGGASGIGEACAHQLAALGSSVVVVDLQEDRGRAVAAAVRIAKQEQFRGKTIVVILPDSGERYLSSILFEGMFEI